MPFWVYILKCSDGTFYTGSTANLTKRINDHKIGIAANYTSARRPVNLVYSKEFQTGVEAIKTEHQIKGWSRKKKQALIENDWKKISILAKSKVDKSN